MKIETIEDLMNSKNENISKKQLYEFFNYKLKELYDKDKSENIFDYDDIRYTAMIELIYELMPSLKNEIKI